MKAIPFYIYRKLMNMHISGFRCFLLVPFLVISVIACQAQVKPYNYSITKEAVYKKAAVGSAHPLASEVGRQIMLQGGNAWDAAIAVQWALAVVYPAAGNLGGGGFMVSRDAKGHLLALDYREMAPGMATENMYVDSATGKANTRWSQAGHLASGVPGTPAGLFATHQYARLPMNQLIQPAIDLAMKGYVITEKEARGLNGIKDALERNNTSLPVFYRDDREWKAGDTLIQRDLANTLMRIRDQGQAGFYEGETARLVVNEMERGAGLISAEDMKNYTAVWRKPIVFDYRGHTIISMPPPSSGGVLLQQMLKMLESRQLAKMGHNSPQVVQLMTEVERRAYADRAEYLGDPDFYEVPYRALVSPAYLAKRMSDYDSTRASKSEGIAHGQIQESMETTHISIVDQHGNMVAVTTTLNGGYGSKVVVGGAGFLLNNEMDDFSVQPGVPNMFGAIGGEANAISPGKRMLSSMTPTLVVKDNKPLMVVGTPGGTTIITSVLQSIVNVVDFKMNADDAVNKPKFHHQWMPDDIRVERDFPEATRKSLEAMGYTLRETGSWSATELLLRNSNGTWQAVGDKRGDDSVAGF